MVIKWKTIAIIFIILFVLETAFVGWALYEADQQIKKDNQCNFNLCKQYAAGYYDPYTDVCTCYDYDNLGSYVEVDYFILD